MIVKYQCLFLAKPDKEIVNIGSSTTECVNTQIITGQYNMDNDYCTLNNNFCDGVVADYVFGRGIVCGGMDSNGQATDTCAFWDCHEQDWSLFQDIPCKLADDSALVVREEGRDKYWVVSGGRCKILLQFYCVVHLLRMTACLQLEGTCLRVSRPWKI
jgi:hypothetical protein